MMMIMVMMTALMRTQILLATGLSHWFRLLRYAISIPTTAAGDKGRPMMIVAVMADIFTKIIWLFLEEGQIFKHLDIKTD
jgi:hypothetical protein